jgi:hypothetical protein
MPFHTYHFIIMLQSFQNLNLIQIYSVTYVNITIVPCCRYVATICTITYPSDLLRVKLLLGETLSHV